MWIPAYHQGESRLEYHTAKDTVINLQLTFGWYQDYTVEGGTPAPDMPLVYPFHYSVANSCILLTHYCNIVSDSILTRITSGY